MRAYPRLGQRTRAQLRDAVLDSFDCAGGLGHRADSAANRLHCPRADVHTLVVAALDDARRHRDRARVRHPLAERRRAGACTTRRTQHRHAVPVRLGGHIRLASGAARLRPDDGLAVAALPLGGSRRRAGIAHRTPLVARAGILLGACAVHAGAYHAEPDRRPGDLAVLVLLEHARDDGRVPVVRHAGPRISSSLRDFFTASVAAAYVAIVLPIDLATGWNYGFVGPGRPEVPTIVDLLGPWPLRLVFIAAIAAGAMAIALLPWVLLRSVPAATRTPAP